MWRACQENRLECATRLHSFIEIIYRDIPVHSYFNIVGAQHFFDMDKVRVLDAARSQKYRRKAGLSLLVAMTHE